MTNARGRWRHFDPIPRHPQPAVTSQGQQQQQPTTRRALMGGATSLFLLASCLILAMSSFEESPSSNSALSASQQRKIMMDVDEVRAMTDQLVKELQPDETGDTRRNLGNAQWMVMLPREDWGDQLFQFASTLGIWIENGGPYRSGLCIHLKEGEGRENSGDDDEESDIRHSETIHRFFASSLMPPCPSQFDDSIKDGPDDPSRTVVDEAGAVTFEPLSLDHDDFKDVSTLKLRTSSFRSYKHFDGLPMKSLFDFRPADKKIGKRVVEEAHERKALAVGIHVGFREVPGFTRVPWPDFYRRAMEYFMEKYDNDIVFIVTSDNMDRAHEFGIFHNGGIELVFNRHYRNVDDYSISYDTIRDLTVLSNCDHIITSLGAVGWWGGYLSKGEVVAFRDVFLDSEQIDDYYPPSWILMGDEKPDNSDNGQHNNGDSEKEDDEKKGDYSNDK